MEKVGQGIIEKLVHVGADNCAAVEFVLAIVKIITCIGLIILGIIINCGGVPSQKTGYIGAKYWHNPGAFANGLKGFCAVFVNAVRSSSSNVSALDSSSIDWLSRLLRTAAQNWLALPQQKPKIHERRYLEHLNRSCGASPCSTWSTCLSWASTFRTPTHSFLVQAPRLQQLE